MLGLLPQPLNSNADGGLAGLPSAELHERYAACRQRETLAAAEAAALLGEIDRRRSFLREGFLSTIAFVAHRTGDSYQAAAGRVRVARTLRQMPHTAVAYRAADIDTAKVRRLVDAHDTSPERFSVDEQLLVDRARSQGARVFSATLAMWKESASADLVRWQEGESHRRRRLTMTDTFWGMVHLEAELDPVSAETVATAIGALTGPANRDGGDGRTPAQRRADALTEICRRYLDAGDLPTAGRRSPHLSAIIDVDTLTGTRSEIGNHRSLGPAAREMLACDATVCGVLMDGPHQVLQMGRRARTATPAQRGALALRDGGCVIDHCDRPPDWCDAHHRTPWTHGGTTDLENLTLICRPHHMMLHHGTLNLPRRE